MRPNTAPAIETQQSAVLPISAITEPILFSVFHWWNQACGGRPMASRADVDPARFRAALVSVLIADHEPLAGEFRYTLFGSKLATNLGADYTGRLITEVQPRPLATLAREHYRSVKDTGVPSLHCLVVSGPRGDHRFLRLCCRF